MMLFSSPYSMYSEVFSHGKQLSGLLPGKTIYHRNHFGVNQLRAQWDPTSDECFIVGSLDEPRQVYLLSYTTDFHYNK